MVCAVAMSVFMGLVVSIVLGFGGMACIVSVIRLHTLHASTTSTDPTWDKNPSGYYGQAEVNLGIICACVATLKPFFRRCWGLRSPSESQQAQVAPQRTKFRHHVPSLNKIPTSTESTRVLSDSRDVELGAIDNDRSRTGSSTTGSETAEVGQGQGLRGPALQDKADVMTGALGDRALH
ncbi:hypothetical protein DL767_001606 [Monosporascus sp. MG133]|nr:hypothetical protein DL767_001606 [Monosporascus sp. MG133]